MTNEPRGERNFSPCGYAGRALANLLSFEVLDAFALPVIH